MGQLIELTGGMTTERERDRMDVVELTGDALTLRDVRRVALGLARVRMPTSERVRADVERSVAMVAELVERDDKVYGITTGFGGRANVLLDREQAAALQTNLLHFHRAGVGEPLDDRDVRAAMLIRANSNLRGASGLRWEVIERFVTFLNEGVTPIVRSHGSIGASGDLTPLAAIAACVIGLEGVGRVRWRGQVVPAREALADLGLEPLELMPKEALAMMNGTAVSTGMAANGVAGAETVLGAALGFHALAIQALAGSPEPFDPFIHVHKPHPGQLSVAATMARLLAGSQLTVAHDPGRPLGGGRLVQDRYSLRCLAQFVGPVVEALRGARAQIEIEANSTSDNPLIDTAAERALHGGNFLAQHVSTSLDAVRLQVGLLAKHLDAQIALMMAPEFSHGLPASLVGNEARGINMGLKAAQITGNALMPLILHHGMPLTHLFATHAEQYNQNVNSLAMGAAHLTHLQLELARQHAAIGLLCATQAVDLRTHAITGHYDARATLSPATVDLYEAVRQAVGRRPDGARPLIYDDHEQAIERFVERIADGLERSGPLARRIAALASETVG